MSKRGEWNRWGRGMCEGWSLEIGNAFRGAVVRQDKFDGPPMWLASVNTAHNNVCNRPDFFTGRHEKDFW